MYAERQQSDRDYRAMQTVTQAAPADLEIPSQTNQLEQAIAALAASADELCSRLAPIRRQTGGAIGSEKPNAPEPLLCPMANVLREARRRVDGVAQQLSAVRSELEV